MADIVVGLSWLFGRRRDSAGDASLSAFSVVVLLSRDLRRRLRSVLLIFRCGIAGLWFVARGDSDGDEVYYSFSAAALLSCCLRSLDVMLGYLNWLAASPRQ